jgi:hypothetical protein
VRAMLLGTGRCVCSRVAQAPRVHHGGLNDVMTLRAEEGVGLEVAFLVEVVEGFVDAAEDFVGGLGDEGGGFFFGFPDDVDFFGVFVGVLEFAFYAAAEAGFAGFAVGAGEFGDVGDGHVGLADEHEVSGVDLAVDVGDDLEEVGGFEVDG